MAPLSILTASRSKSGRLVRIALSNSFLALYQGIF
jgi:hypothetical protein